MSLGREIVTELFAMFAADGRLALGVLIVVGAAAGLLHALRAEPLVAGIVLLLGCLAILVAVASREARRRTGDGRRR